MTPEARAVALRDLAPYLDRYRSHKQVWGAVILGFDPRGALYLLGANNEQIVYRPPDEFFARARPSHGDYLVVYGDGYVSHTPAAAFVEGNTLMASEPKMTGEQRDQALAASPSNDRITPETIKARIARVEYMGLGGTVTICSITLDNGYSVRGESACVDPANYRRDVGEKIAYDNAFRELWPLFGFLLAERLHVRRLAESLA
jgi:hypothetical protein